MADHEQAGHLIDTAVTRWGQLDILVNNAGIVRDAAIWNMEPDDFDAVIRVHLRGTWSCSHHAAVHWRNRAKSGERVIGRIINTTSGAGLTGNFGQTAYASAKAAIVGLTLTLAQELGAYGVTANAVGPAGATRLTGTMPQAPPVVEPDEVPAEEWQPMDPANSSPLVAWLASDESQMITGRSSGPFKTGSSGCTAGARLPRLLPGSNAGTPQNLGKALATDVFRVATPGLRFL